MVFLNRKQLQAFTKMLGGGIAPRQGAFEVVLVSPISATHAEFSLYQTNKVHEATWQSLLGLFDELHRKLNLEQDPKEVLFYAALSTKVLFSEYVNFQWPSSVRNRANYRPGYAYKLQTARSPHFKMISEWAKTKSQDTGNLLDAALRACRSDVTNFGNHVQLMTAVGASLFLLVRELYLDLLTRKRLDRRWEYNRRSYMKKMCFVGKDHKGLGRVF
ncbi:hypothetical protein YTPLAS72_05420 [Nitrospira sp.]|nr:hypothetical protein YTPLAS72_05420 [Nitrospira sp.]